MGYYIEVPEHKNKAEQLVRLHGAGIIPKPRSFNDVPEGKGLICVVENPLFDAAGFCFSEQEFNAFSTDFSRHQRLRTWVLMDLDKAKSLSGYRE